MRRSRACRRFKLLIRHQPDHGDERADECHSNSLIISRCATVHRRKLLYPPKSTTAGSRRQAAREQPPQRGRLIEHRRYLVHQLNQPPVTSDGTAHICVVNWHGISMELSSVNIQRLPETGRRPTMLSGKSITGSTGPGVWLLLRYHPSCPRKRRS